jgi:uncharacterized protein (TIGR02246 family)
VTKSESKPDLTGTWKLSAAKSDFGYGPQPRGRIDVVEHKEPHLRISTHLSNESGESTVVRDLRTDGEVTNQGPWRFETKWDDMTLVIESKNDETGVTSVARLWLSGDGNTLTRKQQWFSKTLKGGEVTVLMDRQLEGEAAFRSPSAYNVSDESEIRTIVASFEEAYGRRDGTLWARYFAEEADFTQAFGIYRQGRSSIAQFMRGFIERQPQAIRPRELGLQISFLRQDVAFVDFRVEVAGIRNRDGSEQPLRRGYMLLVMKKMLGDWKIVHYRFFDVHMGPIRKGEPTPPQ